MEEKRIELEKMASEYGIKVTANMKDATIEKRISEAKEKEKSLNILREQAITLEIDRAVDMTLEELELAIKSVSDDIKKDVEFDEEKILEELTNDSDNIKKLKDDIELAKGRIIVLEKRKKEAEKQIKDIRNIETIRNLEDSELGKIKDMDDQVDKSNKEIKVKMKVITESPEKIKDMEIELETKLKKINRVLLEKEVKNRNKKADFFQKTLPEFITEFDGLDESIKKEDKKIRTFVAKLNGIRPIVNFGANELELTREKLGIEPQRLQNPHIKQISTKIVEIKKFLERKLR